MSTAEVTWRPNQINIEIQMSRGNSTWMSLWLTFSVCMEIHVGIQSWIKWNITFDLNRTIGKWYGVHNGFKYNFIHTHHTNGFVSTVLYFECYRMDIRFIETLKMVNGSVRLLFYSLDTLYLLWFRRIHSI